VSKDNRFWWPLDLSPAEEAATDAFRERMRREPQALDVGAATLAADLLAHKMKRHVHAILEHDSLPYTCHLLNGWGNARLDGRPLLEHLEPFVHRDEEGRPYILQRDAEGEFHPWQGMAYAVMAGVDPQHPLPGVRASFRDIALNCRQLNVTDGVELGHFLYALAALEPEPRSDGAPFLMGADACDMATLMERAVDAHHHGGFEVCRKVHLTEGLCAAAANVRGMERFRADAQGFLDGQLDILFVLGAALEQVDLLAARGEQGGPGTLLHQLREALLIDSPLENHCYYVGHLIELATLAYVAGGYAIPKETWNAMAFVANRLNHTFPRYLPHASFVECFLHFGHYRRAITLLMEVDKAREEGRALTAADFARYTVDFDHLPPLPEGVSLDATGPSPTREGLYTLAPPPAVGRPEFEAIVARYSQGASANLRARGGFPHFRRMMPSSWPRAFHYELLDHGADVGAEIHLESDAVRPLGPRVQALLARVAGRLPGLEVTWDADWSRGRGRLRVLFPAGMPAERVAEGVHALVDETFADLDAAATRLAVPVTPWSHPLTPPSTPATR
jgi:hypothetical protein